MHSLTHNQKLHVRIASNFLSYPASRNVKDVQLYNNSKYRNAKVYTYFRNVFLVSFCTEIMREIRTWCKT